MPIVKETTMTKKPKATIAELEAILEDDSGSIEIEIQPDGSIKAVEGKPNHAKPKTLTFRQALGGTY